MSNGVQESNLLFGENGLPNRSESEQCAYENVRVIVQEEPTKKLKSCLKKIGYTFLKRTSKNLECLIDVTFSEPAS